MVQELLLQQLRNDTLFSARSVSHVAAEQQTTWLRLCCMFVQNSTNPTIGLRYVLLLPQQPEDVDCRCNEHQS
jgi:hypothetical protein